MTKNEILNTVMRVCDIENLLAEIEAKGVTPEDQMQLEQLIDELDFHERQLTLAYKDSMRKNLTVIEGGVK